ncbi:MAG: hypothetical protein HXS49_09740 [Theionarchaea archaeon]|nr:hypothetical protein [Theionarchaea archaeon]MBU7036938.1 hypothetical protein [Theionarchaea archaeon]
MQRQKAILLAVLLITPPLLAAEGPRGPLCDPFRPEVENHIWFWWPEGIAGFEFDDSGTLLYIVDGIPAQSGELISSSVQKEFRKLPLTGEFTFWRPIKKDGLGGFWLKHFAVKTLNQPWGTVSPGVDYNYHLNLGKKITEIKREDFKSFKEHPFAQGMGAYIWKKESSELYGIEFDTKGVARYLVHGIPGEYSLDDVPPDGYMTWQPVDSKSKEGYWLKHVAVRELRMPWGTVYPGIDYRFQSEHTLGELTRRQAAEFTDNPFTPELANHIWKKEGDTLRGFRFDEKGHLRYMVEGIKGSYTLDDVPFSGEYTVWVPVSPTSSSGYWLNYAAVAEFEMPWGTVHPGIDYRYEDGKSTKDLPKSSKFTFEPFPEGDLENHIWSQEIDCLYGAEFDTQGNLLYLVHGVPGTYSLNDVPLSGEYVVWYPLEGGEQEGVWLKYVAVREVDMEWGPVTYGIDLSYNQQEGHGISFLTREDYHENWDLLKLLKYFWDVLMED